MGRNCNDLSKNFSLPPRQGEPWRLSPAHDITFAHNPKGEWTHQHLMAVNGKFKGITRADLLAEADRRGIGTARRVLDEVRVAVETWPSYAEAAGVLPAETEKIHQLLEPL